MILKKILEEINKEVNLDEKTLKYLKKETKKVVDVLKKEINRQKVEAEAFVGGSFAKGTLEKKGKYDIDVFIRFDWRLDNISKILENIVKKVGRELNFAIKKVHGSRDYFRLENKNVFFEIVPVYRIRHPKEARNVTDLSYFHVNYVKNKIKRGNLANEIMVAKKFFQAQKLYGAETFISGFSGYGIECLIINYRSFEKMLRELRKVKFGERLILDPERLYKKKQDILFGMNESKLHSPIILVDPTWKERNVLAALSWEIFRKFQETAMKFLKTPSRSFFEMQEFDIDNLKKLNGELIHLKINTEKQEGDIAGTKMKKFSRFLERELMKYFEILKSEFVYVNGQEGNFYLVLKSKGEVVKFGPPISMWTASKGFRKSNPGVFERDGHLYSRIRVDFSGKEFLERFFKKELKRKIKEMGISGVEIM